MSDQIPIDVEKSAERRAMEIVNASAKRSDTALAQVLRVWPLVTAIFMAGFAYAVFSSHSDRINKLDTEMTSMREKMSDIGSDIKMILSEQRRIRNAPEKDSHP